MTLDYFYGQAGELFSFFRIPKALFQEQRFQSLSTDARTLYGILLDRMSLSVKNGWLDEQGGISSSVYLESDLNLPFGKNGKFLFQLGYTPVMSDMNKIVQKAAASSFPTWTLAVWDMDTATLYMVKYDRSH